VLSRPGEPKEEKKRITKLVNKKQQKKHTYTQKKPPNSPNYRPGAVLFLRHGKPKEERKA
jgi:hypothetical protein